MFRCSQAFAVAVVGPLAYLTPCILCMITCGVSCSKREGSYLCMLCSPGRCCCWMSGGEYLPLGWGTRSGLGDLLRLYSRLGGGESLHTLLCQASVVCPWWSLSDMPLYHLVTALASAANERGCLRSRLCWERLSRDRLLLGERRRRCSLERLLLREYLRPIMLLLKQLCQRVQKKGGQ